MVAFTSLSPLHISLPIRLTTDIHTHWLFIPPSFHLASFSALHCSGFHFPPLLPPSSLFLSHFLLSLSLPLTGLETVSLSPHLTIVFFHFHIQYWHPFPPAFYTFWLTKEDRVWQRSDRGVIVSKGWVGLQYTRLPHEEALWAFFCFLPREKVYVNVRVWMCVCQPPYNYDCVGRLFWYASGCFSMQALT